MKGQERYETEGGEPPVMTLVDPVKDGTDLHGIVQPARHADISLESDPRCAHNPPSTLFFQHEEEVGR